MKDVVQIDSVVEERLDEITHMTNTKVTSSNINKMSHVVNEENQPPIKPTNLQKSKSSVSIAEDSKIKIRNLTDTFLQVL